MFDSQAVAKAVDAGALAFGLEAGGSRKGPAVRRLIGKTVSIDAIRTIEKEALRHRLLQMILRNEQMRRRMPR